MEKKSLEIIRVEIIKTKSETVRARADVYFQRFWVKGFKVLLDEGKEYVMPPSYRAGVYWRPLFRTESKEDWQEIVRRVLKEYEGFLMKESADETFNK